MTKIVIIEDEIPARKKLKRFLETLNDPIEVVAEIDSVKKAIEFLKTHQVDLIFSDIELLDGNAFEIYQQLPVKCPIIFTTAYDQFWMDAFDSNGIAYLLKPFSKERFQKAWNKFLWLSASPSDESKWVAKLKELIQQNISEKSYKKRFTLHTSRGMYFLETGNIVFFEADEGVIFAYDNRGQKHVLTETTLKEVEEQIRPEDFFRINRSEIISKTYIERIERYSKNSLAIKLKAYENYLKTSQNNTALFREWIEK